MKKLFTIGILVFTCALSFAKENDSIPKQKKHNLFLNASTGINFYSCRTSDYDFMRSTVTYYRYGYPSSTLSWFFSQLFVDAKLEYRFENKQLWALSGIRYTKLRSSLGRSSGYSSSPDFFYINMTQSEDEANYYRIKSVNYNLDYLGIPLELRYTPFLPRFFRMFFKVGVDVNFLVSDYRSVAFVTPAMEYAEDEILALFDPSPAYFGSAYIGAGFQFGEPDGMAIRIESNLPAFVFSPHSFGAVEPEWGGGIMFSVLIPLN